MRPASAAAAAIAGLIRCVIAPSFGEIFYSNAMNNRLLLAVLPEAQVQALMDEADRGAVPTRLAIDLRAGMVRSPRHAFSFALSERHRRMMLEGLDMIGLSLTHRAEIDAFAAAHWARQPWLKDVGGTVVDRLHSRDDRGGEARIMRRPLHNAAAPMSAAHPLLVAHVLEAA